MRLLHSLHEDRQFESEDLRHIPNHDVSVAQLRGEKSIMSLSHRSVVRFDGLHPCYKPSTYLTTIFCPSLSSCISTTRSKLFLRSAANIFASSEPSNSFT